MCVSTILFGQCCLNSGATKTNVIEELSTIILLEVGSIVVIIVVYYRPVVCRYVAYP